MKWHSIVKISEDDTNNAWKINKKNLYANTIQKFEIKIILTFDSSIVAD